MSPLTKMNQSNLDYVEMLLDKALDAEQKNTDESLKLATEALELSKNIHLKNKKLEAMCVLVDVTGSMGIIIKPLNF